MVEKSKHIQGAGTRWARPVSARCQCLPIAQTGRGQTAVRVLCWGLAHLAKVKRRNNSRDGDSRSDQGVVLLVIALLGNLTNMVRLNMSVSMLVPSMEDVVATYELMHRGCTECQGLESLVHD